MLQRLPGKLDTITRTATYGSWFNFYLCDFEGRVILSDTVTYTPELPLGRGEVHADAAAGVPKRVGAAVDPLPRAQPRP